MTLFCDCLDEGSGRDHKQEDGILSYLRPPYVSIEFNSAMLHFVVVSLDAADTLRTSLACKSRKDYNCILKKG